VPQLPWIDRFILWLYGVSADYAVIDDGTARPQGAQSVRSS
jgi:hypothetical protein